MKKNPQADQYRKIGQVFGGKAPVPTTDGEEDLKQLSVFIPLSLFRRVKAAVAVDNEHRTMKSLLMHLLTEWLESRGK